MLGSSYSSNSSSGLLDIFLVSGYLWQVLLLCVGDPQSKAMHCDTVHGVELSPAQPMFLTS
jgi:hypothetical protein